MMHIYVSCGLWELGPSSKWVFSVDEEKGGRLLVLEANTSLEELKRNVLEDFSLEEDADLEFSYLPSQLVDNSGCPPVIISNNRQLKNFVAFLKKKVQLKKNASPRLCVTIKAKNDSPFEANVDLSLSIIPTDASNDVASQNSYDTGNASNNVSDGIEREKGKGKMYEDDVDGDDSLSETTRSEEEEEESRKSSSDLADAIVKNQLFQDKDQVISTFEMLAMKNNFSYSIVKSDTKLWCIRCEDTTCSWYVRAQRLTESSLFIIRKYVDKHSCAPSSRSNAGKVPSSKTIGGLIKHKYEGVKEGPKPYDIIQIMRSDHGCEISYSLAWDSREWAVNAVRGIPEKSYGKIPKYLHMLGQANPGTHSAYETDADGKFKYLFLAFGQSVRGFNNCMRRLIVVDGTFLKSKYKGTLLVATALDGNSNLYPIAFGVVDSENDRSWEWFLTQLKEVVDDDNTLAFISDRHGSIVKSLEKVYPAASHGICVHHMINNVVTYFKGKGLASLISKASKVYRDVEFEKIFADIRNISPGIGEYLVEAGVEKWARCKFPGYRYDIRTTNPAESLNSALCGPREYPVIPLLDSIRERLTEWFYERKIKIAKHQLPLTKYVEKKIARRIDKGKGFVVFPVDEHRFQVKGDVIDCVVDLDRRTCSCRKYDLLKIPCRHAIKAGFHVGREPQFLTDYMYTTAAWSAAYVESINPVSVPEDSWSVPEDVEKSEVKAPESRRSVGRKRKRRHETVEDKIRKQGSKGRKCSRCHQVGHYRGTCEMAI